MPYGLALTTLIVRDYDEALDFFVGKLGFILASDTPSTTINEKKPKRWVVVQPPGTIGAGLLLAQADGTEQKTMIGKQFAGRVGLFWHVDDFDAEYQRLIAAGVQFVRSPKIEDYGKVAVFEDLYGNKWDLMQPF